MDYNGTNTSYIDKRSASMAIASMVIGIAGMVMSCCIYPAIIFGSAPCYIVQRWRNDV